MGSRIVPESIEQIIVFVITVGKDSGKSVEVVLGGGFSISEADGLGKNSRRRLPLPVSGELCDGAQAPGAGDAPRSVEEVFDFCQDDLEMEDVFILDSYLKVVTI